MTPEKCPHCGMTWNETMGEYECGSYPAGSSVVRATACTEIARLQAQLSQAERVVVPELLDSEIEVHYLESIHAIPADIDAKEREWCFKDCRWAYNLAASRAHSVPASRVLKDGEEAVSSDLLAAYRDLHRWAIHCGFEGWIMDHLDELGAKPSQTDALRAQGKEGAT